MKETLRKVAEKIAPTKEQAPDRTSEMAEAANIALEAAHSLGNISQFDALITFDRHIRDGESVNQALSRATGPIATEVTVKTGDRFTANRIVAEIGERFWDAMGPHEDGEEPTPAIERALNGFAPDGGSWLEAKAAFDDAIERGAQVGIALDIALGTIKTGAETHPEVAKDRFYAGIDPDYAAKDHFDGKKRGARIGLGGKGIEIGVGQDVRAAHQRRVGKLAAQYSQTK